MHGKRPCLEMRNDMLVDIGALTRELREPRVDGTLNVAASTPMQSRSRAANGQPINDHQAKCSGALNRRPCVDRRLKGADYEQRSFHSIEHLGRAVDVAMPAR
jgi:hypothetical protein